MRKSLAAAVLPVLLAGAWIASPAGLHSAPPAPAVAAAPELFAEGIVSTPDDEFGAAFTPDSRTVYFTKRTPTTNTSPLSVICFSVLKDGRWQSPEIAPFSGFYGDVGPAISADGRRLYFASDRPLPGTAGRTDLNIWFVERSGEGWSEPRPIGPSINTEAEDLSPSVSADGTLYFASNRPGGRGGLDLWRARPSAGGFAEAENLGEINSPGSDGAPCIARDQSFLVFASSGRSDRIRGRGHDYPRSDLYWSSRTATGWSAPHHLDPPWNTSASESNPSLSPDGAFLFFSSDRGFATIPMTPRVTAAAFAAGLQSVRSGWNNTYRADVRWLGLPTAKPR